MVSSQLLVACGLHKMRLSMLQIWHATWLGSALSTCARSYRWRAFYEIFSRRHLGCLGWASKVDELRPHMYRYIITYCNTVMTYIIFTKARLRLRVAVVVLGQPASEKCKPNQISHRPATPAQKSYARCPAWKRIGRRKRKPMSSHWQPEGPVPAIDMKGICWKVMFGCKTLAILQLFFLTNIFL